MSATTPDTSNVKSAPTAHDRAIDAARQVAHLSHEAQLLGSLAADAVEDGVHAAKRAIKSVERGVEKLGDRKDELAYRVKRHPLTASPSPPASVSSSAWPSAGSAADQGASEREARSFPGHARPG